MDEMLLLRLTGGLGTGLDLTAALTFIAFALVHFLAPLVTHTRERPTALSGPRHYHGAAAGGVVTRAK